MGEMRRLVIGAVFLAAGCGAELLPEQAVYVDPSVPMDAVVKATQVWGQVGARYTFVADAADIKTVTVTAGNEPDCLPSADGKLWVGATRSTPAGDVVYIRMACYTDHSPATTIAHELGHVLTLGHIEGRPALMAAFYDDRAEPTLTSADRSAFAAAWGQPNP